MTLKQTRTPVHQSARFAVGALLLAAVSATAEPLVQESFANQTGADQAVSALSAWQVSVADGTADLTRSGYAAGQPSAGIGPAHSAHAAFDAGTPGIVYMYVGASPVTTAFLLWTTLDGTGGNPPPIEPDAFTEFGWFQGHGSAASETRLAVEIDGQWFLSRHGFAMEGTPLSGASEFAASAEEKRVLFSRDAAEWSDFAFTPGSVFAVTANPPAREEDLPAGPVTAAGLYNYVVHTAGAQTSRVDAFEMRSLPDPDEPQPPVITGHPRSRRVLAGSDVTFSVDATGTPPLHYQWRLDGEPLAGETAPTLHLAAVTPDDAGDYDVVVHAGADLATVSSPARLTVVDSGAVRLLIVAGEANALGTGATGGDLAGTHLDEQSDIPLFHWLRASGSESAPVTGDSGAEALGTQFVTSGDNPFLYDTSPTPGGHGPEVTLARTLADVAGSGPVAVVKVAASDSVLGGSGSASGQSWWKPGGTLHTRLLEEIDNAVAELAADEFDAYPAALFWIQGESDARRDGTVDNTAFANAYHANLGMLVESLRTHYDTPELPVVVARIDPAPFGGADYAANAATVRNAQTGYVRATAHSAWVDMDDLPRVGGGDQHHLSDAGLRRLGWRMARAYLRLQALAGRPADAVVVQPGSGQPRRDFTADNALAVLPADGWQPSLDITSPDSGFHTATFAHTRRTDTGRKRLSLQYSHNLSDWAPTDDWDVLAAEPAGAGLERITLRSGPWSAGEPIFIRPRPEDTRTLDELTFEKTRDLWLRMVRGWAGRLNSAGTGWENVPTYFYEAATRMAFPLAAWLSQPGREGAWDVDGVEVDPGELLVTMLRHGTDPGHPQRWPRSPSNQWDQIIVESAVVALAAWILQAGGSSAWDALSSADRSNINSFLQSMPTHTYTTNWTYFVHFNHFFRKRLNDAGVSEFGGHNLSVMENSLRRAYQLKRGGGWYSDHAETDIFDDYTPLVLAAYPMILFMADPGVSESQTRLSDTGGIGRREILRGVARFVAAQPWFFDDGGAHPEFGRSTSYKMGRLITLILAYHLEFAYNRAPGGWNYDFSIFPEDEISVGQLRRLIRLHLNHYLRNETIDPDHFRIHHGLTREGGPLVMEEYLERSPGSVYWAGYPFAALWLLADDDPLWSTPEEPLPAEENAFDRWNDVPGFLLRARPDTGHLELFNSATNGGVSLRSYNYTQYMNKYNKFSYSSRIGYTTRDGTRLDQCLLINNVIRDDPEGDLYRPAGWADGEPGVLRTAADIDGRRVSTLIFFRGGAQIRVHRITGPAGFQLREGGYALGRNAGETPAVQTGADWTYRESSRGAALFARLAGYNENLTASDTGTHSRDPAWTMDGARTASVGNTPHYAAVMVKASAFPFEPTTARNSLASISADADGANLQFTDGSTQWAPFLP